jgi:ankyrin repeat protein
MGYLAAARCGQKVLDLLAHYNDLEPIRDEWVRIAEFYSAAKSGDLESVTQLLDAGVPSDLKNIRGVTPLWIAASKGHNAIVKLLLGRGDVDVNSRSISGRSPIF